MKYGQFCPIAKAMEVVGERWTILIVRELLMGARRFSEIQRGLGDISPALLTGRLKSLEAQGLVARRGLKGQRGHEYFPTPACEALMPVLIALGEWGLQSVRHTLTTDDLDAAFLMLYLERSIDPQQLVGRETIIRFAFTDLTDRPNWWLLVQGDKVELCLTKPGRDVDVYFTTTTRTMHDVWMGDRSYRDAIGAGDLIIEGEPALIRNTGRWIRPSVFATAPRAAPPMDFAA